MGPAGSHANYRQLKLECTEARRGYITHCIRRMKHEIPVFHHSPPIQSSKIISIFSLCIGRSTSLAMPADEDPLTLALAPPANETYEQRLAREAAEAEAK